VLRAVRRASQCWPERSCWFWWRRGRWIFEGRLQAFPLFAAAVITATQRGVPQSRLDWTALAWLCVRVCYTGAYLGDWAGIRPVLWAVSVLIAIGIFILPT
jgi:uncharacterized MAPEG superfamily protein